MRACAFFARGAKKAFFKCAQKPKAKSQKPEAKSQKPKAKSKEKVKTLGEESPRPPLFFQWCIFFAILKRNPCPRKKESRNPLDWTIQ
ncbi:MAG: hypothetical protein HQL99_10430 [Magnetococcales bacterium]|nr:hypothetical protein [Magnetococcales bacterium]